MRNMRDHIEHAPHTELQHVNKHVKRKTPTHISTLKPTYPNQKDTKPRHITYTKQDIQKIKEYIMAKPQTLKRCKHNQKHSTNRICKHQRKNNACLMSTHNYFDRELSVYKNRASTIKSKCFNRSNKFTTQIEITM